MDDLLAALATHWRATDAEPAAGASEADIHAFEVRHGVRLPADVRSYFQALNGMAADTWDREFIAFWPLARVRTVADELSHHEPTPPPADAFYCFADYSIWCNAYAVRLSADGPAPSEVVAVYGGVALVPVAASFAEFLGAYLGPNPYTVLHPPWTEDGTPYGAAT